MKALILAAGFGSRLGLDIPKPMYKINGLPVLEHNILLLKEYGITNIYINLHYKPEAIKEYFVDGNKWGVNITYSFEENLLGTSGAVKKLESFLDKELFFVIYGDNYTNINLSEMLGFHKSSKAMATIGLFDPKKVENSGIAGGVITIDDQNNIQSFIEGRNIKNTGYVNAGVYILEPEVLKEIPQDEISDFGKDIFPKLLKNGQNIKGYITDSFVFAIDTNEALQITEDLLRKGIEK